MIQKIYDVTGGCEERTHSLKSNLLMYFTSVPTFTY